MSEPDSHPVDVALENRLMSHGIYLTDCQRRPPDDAAGGPDSSDSDGTTDPTDPLRDGTGLALEYETVSPAAGVESEEVGAVVRTLLDVADEREWTPGRLEATSLTTDGEVRGTWHVEREWFERLGLTIDDVEFSQRVLETVTETPRK